MTVRLVILPVAFATLFAFAGCTDSSESGKTGSLPQAPEPRLKGEKSKAELLIGTWKFVKQTPPIRPFHPVTYEYTKDGKVTLWKHPSGHFPWAEEEKEVQVRTGTYRVDGDMLIRSIHESPVTIVSITEDKLVTSISLSDDPAPITGEYERVRDK
jgi:hypothetical protein